MRRSDVVLAWLLRVLSAILLAALVPAVMPFSWMREIHQWLGMGELPAAPITSYLARSLSALYAAHGALVFLVSLDVRRYLPVVRCLGWLGVALGAGMIVLDVSVGMPVWWTLIEGPLIVFVGAAVLWLARGVAGPEKGVS